MQRCRALPEGKAAAENVQALAEAAAQLDRDIESYGNTVANWRDVASAYRQRQKPTGFELTKVRELALPLPADADRRRAEFAARNDAVHLEALAHRLFRSLAPTARGLAPMKTAKAAPIGPPSKTAASTCAAGNGVLACRRSRMCNATFGK